LGHAGSLDLYSYANNDPINWTDPDGRFGKQAWNATIGNPKVQGGLTAAGGVGAMLGGAALLAVPEPTTLTKIGGMAAVAYGADLTVAGARQLWTGQPTPSLTAQGVSRGLQAAGVNPQLASGIGSAAELGALPIGVVKVGTTAGRAGATALHGAPRAESAAAAQLLKKDLLRQEASSAFTASGQLSPGALAGSREIMRAELLRNPNIPAGFSKWGTDTFRSPSGDFQVHFYRHPITKEVHYGLDYKAKFNSPPTPLWPGSK
jgi:hypothetical protein